MVGRHRASMTNTCTGRTGSLGTPVFVDTSAPYALADANDLEHTEAVRLLQSIERMRYALMTSNFVVSEVYTLLLKRVGRQVAISYVDGLSLTMLN